MGKITAELADGSILEASASIVSITTDTEHDYDLGSWWSVPILTYRLEANLLDGYKITKPKPAYKVDQELITEEDYANLPDGATVNPSRSYLTWRGDSMHYIKRDGMFCTVDYYPASAWPAIKLTGAARTVRSLPDTEVTISAKKLDLLNAELVDVHEEKETLRARVAELVEQVNKERYVNAGLRNAISEAKYELDLVA